MFVLQKIMQRIFIFLELEHFLLECYTVFVVVVFYLKINFLIKCNKLIKICLEILIWFSLEHLEVCSKVPETTTSVPGI